MAFIEIEVLGHKISVNLAQILYIENDGIHARIVLNDQRRSKIVTDDSYEQTMQLVNLASASNTIQ